MKRNVVLLKRAATLALGALVLGVAGCQKPPKVILPTMTITYGDKEYTNDFSIAAKGTPGEFDLVVVSTSPWNVAGLAEGDSWISVDPLTGGKGTTAVKITVGAGDTKARQGKVVFQMADGKNIRRTVAINQEAGNGPEGAIYYEDAGNLAVKDKPKVSAYTGWSKKGTPEQGDVTYGGNADVRNSGMYWSLTGSDNKGAPAPYVYLGANQASAQPFLINGIKTGGKTNFTLTWIMQDTEKATENSPYIPTFRDITPTTLKFKAGFNGTDYADVDYTVGTVVGNGWTNVKAEFKVPEGKDKLYLYFGNFVSASNQGLRLDNFTLTEGGEGNLINPGTTPPPTPTFAVGSASPATVEAGGGDATVSVTTGESVEWKAEITSGSGATIKSGTPGTGNGTVTVNFPENTETVEKSVTVTISTTDATVTGEKSHEVVFKQAAAGTPPPPPASLLFPGSDFNDWNAFKGALDNNGLKHATESVDGGRDGKGAMQIKLASDAIKSGNPYLFSAKWPAGLTPDKISKISFYVKGTAKKSLSMNVYYNGEQWGKDSKGKDIRTDNYDCFNLEDCSADKVLKATDRQTSDNIGNGSNKYTGTINTGDKWVKITLNIATGSIVSTEGDAKIFAIKIGNKADYDLLIDDITYE